MWPYSYWLASLGLLFVVLERLWPRLPTWIADLDAVSARGWVASWSAPAQFAILLVTADFVKWCVHNLMHRVGLLWRFHRLHHGIEEMDWLVTGAFTLQR